MVKYLDAGSYQVLETIKEYLKHGGYMMGVFNSKVYEDIKENHQCQYLRDYFDNGLVTLYYIEEIIEHIPSITAFDPKTTILTVTDTPIIRYSWYIRVTLKGMFYMFLYKKLK